MYRNAIIQILHYLTVVRFLFIFISFVYPINSLWLPPTRGIVSVACCTNGRFVLTYIFHHSLAWVLFLCGMFYNLCIIYVTSHSVLRMTLVVNGMISLLGFANYLPLCLRPVAHTYVLPIGCTQYVCAYFLRSGRWFPRSNHLRCQWSIVLSLSTSHSNIIGFGQTYSEHAIPTFVLFVYIVHLHFPGPLLLSTHTKSTEIQH